MPLFLCLSFFGECGFSRSFAPVYRKKENFCVGKTAAFPQRLFCPSPDSAFFRDFRLNYTKSFVFHRFIKRIFCFVWLGKTFQKGLRRKWLQSAVENCGLWISFPFSPCSAADVRDLSPDFSKIFGKIVNFLSFWHGLRFLRQFSQSFSRVFHKNSHLFSTGC